MTHPFVNDRIAALIAMWLVTASVAAVLLFPDIDRAGISALNFAFCGLALWSGFAPSRDRRMRAWEQVQIATWLVISPWVLGFDNVPVTAINAIACSVLLFSFSGWAVAQREEQPVRVAARRRRH
jgi:hypothetical protein